MNNVYLIYGDEPYLIKKELSKIIDNSKVIQDNIIRYNLDDVNISITLEEACTISMFDSEKLIICENSNFLTSENKKEINHDIDSLVRYINNPFFIYVAPPDKGFILAVLPYAIKNRQTACHNAG